MKVSKEEEELEENQRGFSAGKEKILISKAARERRKVEAAESNCFSHSPCVFKFYVPYAL